MCYSDHSNTVHREWESAVTMQREEKEDREKKEGWGRETRQEARVAMILAAKGTFSSKQF